MYGIQIILRHLDELSPIGPDDIFSRVLKRCSEICQRIDTMFQH